MININFLIIISIISASFFSTADGMNHAHYTVPSSKITVPPSIKEKYQKEKKQNSGYVNNLKKAEENKENTSTPNAPKAKRKLVFPSLTNEEKNMFTQHQAIEQKEHAEQTISIEYSHLLYQNPPAHYDIRLLLLLMQKEISSYKK